MYQLLKDTVDQISVDFKARPVTCTCALYDPNGGLLTADSSTGITIGPQTNLSGDAGLGQLDRRVAPVDSITSFNFLDLCRVKNTSLQYEYVRLIAVPASKTLELDKELSYAYADGDIFESVKVTRSFTATETATLGVNYRARFHATFSGLEDEYKDILLDVVMQKIEQPITSRNLADYDPLLLRKLPAEDRGTQWASLLDRAWVSVYQDIVAQKIRPELIISADQLAMPQLYKFKKLCSENNIKLISDEEYPLQSARYFQKEYQNSLEEVLRNIKWFDSSEDLSPTNDEKPMQARLTI
jgi:hypothetical protein